MDLYSILAQQFPMVSDKNARKRDSGEPDKLVVESSWRMDNRAQLVTELHRTNPPVSVFVDATSRVWQLTAGGSGIIIYESPDGNYLDDEQKQTVEGVVKAFEKVYPKLKKRKKAEPVEPEAEAPAEPVTDRIVFTADEFGGI